MAEGEKFDFVEFVSTLRDLSPQGQRGRVAEEVTRMQMMLVRESSGKFEQQIYLRRVERLSQFLGGQDVAADLTPSEKRAYELLTASANR